MPGLYDPWFVTLSVAVAIFSSTLALQMIDVAGRGRSWFRSATLLTASVVLGAGIWTMHFIAMLAFNLCTAVNYDPFVTALSLLPSLGASALALSIISRPSMTRTGFLLGGVLVGSGIGLMHYVGMSAMRMVPVLRYDPWFFSLSILVAVALACLALWIRFGLRGGSGRSSQIGRLLASGTVMGLAISGMHYTGMAAARFYGDPVIQDPAWRPHSGFLAFGVILATVLIALLAAAINAILRYRAIVAELKLSETRIRAHAEQAAKLLAENQIRLKTEEALRASRKRLVAITDSVAYSILVINPAGQFVFANKAAHQLFGIAELEGLPLDDMLQFEKDGEMVPFSRSPLSRAIEEGVPVHDHDAVLHLVSSRASIPASYTGTPITETSWKRNLVLSIRDITDMKQAQNELLQASRLASVGQLAAGIAHEINTPVQYIGNNLSFIGDSVRQLLDLLSTLRTEPENYRLSFLTEELPAAIAESLDGVAQISRIVLSMKEFSHPGNAAKTMVDINRALDTTLTVSTNVWKHVAMVRKYYDPDLPMVPCLAGEINQVFLNLIVNAAQAIEESDKAKPGLITISTARGEDYAEVRIEDSGPGIPATIRGKIFDPFFTTKEVGKGTGQGLAICQDVIVTKHGGRLDLGGEEGIGAIFTVRLPLDPSPASGELA